jgi:hypothetical protein
VEDLTASSSTRTASSSSGSSCSKGLLGHQLAYRPLPLLLLRRQRLQPSQWLDQHLLLPLLMVMLLLLLMVSLEIIVIQQLHNLWPHTCPCCCTSCCWRVDRPRLCVHPAVLRAVGCAFIPPFII